MVGITDLPPELIENIAWSAAFPVDLANLRLVSKQVAAGTERPTLQRDFRHLFIMVAMPSSLRRALKVARHPQLRRYISDIHIFSANTFSMMLIEKDMVAFGSRR
jgi:hypothetical protein